MAWMFVLFFSWTALAGSFTAEIDKTVGTLDDTFEYTLTVEGSFDGEPKLPEIDGLEIDFAGKSSSASWINGKFSKEERYTYVITPNKAGKYSLPSIKLKVDGEVIATAPLQFQVSASGQIPQNPSQSDGESRELFVVRSASKPEVFVGEQVIVTTKIYTRVQMAEAHPESVTQSEFKRYNIEGEKNYQSMVGQRRYTVIELNEVWIPLTPGDLQVKPFVLKAKVASGEVRSRPKRPGGMFEDFFGNDVFSRRQFVQKTFRSNDVALKVKALPSEGRGDNFSGVVGAFELKAGLQPTQVKTSETSTLTISLEGEGILSGLTDLHLNMDPNLKVYADKPDEKQVIDATAGIHSSKTFKYALVPTKAGIYALGKIGLTVFDPKQGKYVELRQNVENLVAVGPEEPMAVTQGDANVSRIKQSAVKALGSDLLPLRKDDVTFTNQRLTGKDRIILSAICGLPLLTLFLQWGFLRLRQNQTRNASKIRRSQAYKRFKSSYLDVKNPLQAFRLFMGDKLNVSGQALTDREILTKLQALNVPTLLLDKVQSLLSQLTRVEYGSGSAEISLEDLRKELLAIVRELDKIVR